MLKKVIIAGVLSIGGLAGIAESDVLGMSTSKAYAASSEDFSNYENVTLPDDFPGSLDKADTVKVYRFVAKKDAKNVTFKLNGPKNEIYKVSLYEKGKSKALSSVEQGQTGSAAVSGNKVYYLRVAVYEGNWNKDNTDHKYTLNAHYS
ncbi:TPA: hypothetical protein ACGXP3_005073 [Bacillus cereus]|uniref:hypothetical protein n=1 Tax=Bacillus cereus TaxID=1396 RepID=UPI000BF470A8|nr:hypothetical protein [Bacillus cereus]PFO87729.1 hypothetical protein COJ89_22065 [Bacillus cereus]